MNALFLARKSFASILDAVSDEDFVRPAEIEGATSPIAYIATMNGHIAVDKVS
jgi:hypothetical protein